RLPAQPTICTEVGSLQSSFSRSMDSTAPVSRFTIPKLQAPTPESSLLFRHLFPDQFCITANNAPKISKSISVIKMRFNHLRLRSRLDTGNFPIILMGELFRAWFGNSPVSLV